ncbi:hypothetical protein QLY45_18670, partial [Cronobacter sakazakii]|nr:hypothetical protein [Cronobacter sakazakii]
RLGSDGEGQPRQLADASSVTAPVNRRFKDRKAVPLAARLSGVCACSPPGPAIIRPHTPRRAGRSTVSSSSEG